MPLFLKLVIKQSRGGAFTLLLLSTAIAVACITAIALVNSRIHNTILDEATHFLAADAQIRGTKPIPEPWQTLAMSNGLELANSTHFSAMAFYQDASRLVSVKAVSDSYPLKGAVTLADTPYSAGFTLQAAPKPGEIWITSRLFDLLGVKVGDRLELGKAEFTLTKALIKEPDSPQTYFNTAPRVIINNADVEQTGAVQLGSRVRYGLMMAGDKAALRRLKNSLASELGEHHRWQGIENANRFVGSAMEKAQGYIFLAGSLCVLLAGVAIALSARRFAHEQLKTVALLKTFGMRPSQVQQFYLSSLLLCAVVSSAIGSLIGWGTHLAIVTALGDYLPNLAGADFSAYAIGFATGLVALLGFATPTILALKKVPPMQVLQATFSGNIIGNLKVLAFGALTIALLTFALSRSLPTSLILLLGVGLSFAMVYAVVRFVLSALASIAPRMPPALKLGLVNLKRHKNYNLSQISIFSLIFLVLFTLHLSSQSLIRTWQQNIPENAPNHFIFNIFSFEKEAVKNKLDALKIDRQPFYPMVRGRVVSVEEESLETLTERQRHHVNYQREMNLTWSETLASDNKILEGTWWTDDNGEPLLVSVEEDFALGLDLQLGDEITFSISGTAVSALVQNIRSVKWDSMHPNFYVIFNKPILESVSPNWLTSFYLPTEDKPLLNQIVREHPTISLIELDQTLAQIQSIIQKVSTAIEFIWAMILIAGILVFVTSIHATLDLRLQEGAIMRALGASKKLIRNVLLVEFACMGLLAGTMATLSAQILFYFIQSRLFDFEPSWALGLWLWGPAATAVVIASVGYWSTRRVTTQAPLVLLRESS